MSSLPGRPSPSSPLRVNPVRAYEPMALPTRSTAERIVGLLLVIALVVGLLGTLIWYFGGLMVYLVVGMLLAYLMRPLVNRVEGFGLELIPAIVVTFILVFGGLGFLMTQLVPLAATQVAELSQQVTDETIRNVAASLEERITQMVPLLLEREGVIIEGLTQLIETLFLSERITQLVGSVVAVFGDILFAVLVIPFVTFFFLKDGARIRRTVLHLVPNRYFEVTLTVLEQVETNIGHYLRALMFQCLSVAGVATLMLYGGGLEYALAVGLFTGLANTIPYFGPMMGLLAGTLVGIAQTGDFSLLLPVAIAMLVTQVADNLLFQPIIFSRAAKTHPLVILFVVLVGAQLGGIVGMLLAIPLTTTVRVAIEEVLWSRRNYRMVRTMG